MRPGPTRRRSEGDTNFGVTSVIDLSIGTGLIRLASTANPSPPTSRSSMQRRRTPLEHATEEIALPMPVLGKRRVIRHRPIQTEPTEPPVGQIEVNLITQPPFRSNVKAVTGASGSSVRDQSTVDRYYCRTSTSADAGWKLSQVCD